VLLVGITGLAYAALELDPGALLHHVRGLMRGSVERGVRRVEPNIAASCIALGPHPIARIARTRVGVSAHIRDIMLPERRLDPVHVR
jgi:hypothetical protein